MFILISVIPERPVKGPLWFSGLRCTFQSLNALLTPAFRVITRVWSHLEFIRRQMTTRTPLGAQLSRWSRMTPGIWSGERVLINYFPLCHSEEYFTFPRKNNKRIYFDVVTYLNSVTLIYPFWNITNDHHSGWLIRPLLIMECGRNLVKKPYLCAKRRNAEQHLKWPDERSDLTELAQALASHSPIMWTTRTMGFRHEICTSGRLQTVLLIPCHHSGRFIFLRW